MEKYAVIAVGAVLGAWSRHWLGEWSLQRWGSGFAYGTLLINLLGSFVLGFFLALHLDKGLFSNNLRLLVAVGWCASFTTYSTFSWDTLRYLQEGRFQLAAWNMGLTLGGCLLATWVGFLLAKWV